MEVHKYDYEKLNFDTKLQPLFDAMKRGETISEINYIPRVAIKRNHITNFKASDYYCCMQSNGNKKFDYVIGKADTKETEFYMNWIKSFVI